MPSQEHEVLVEMFRDRPSLAAELLDGPLHTELPSYDEVRLSSAELTDVTPTEYRADAVVTLTRAGKDVHTVVVEVQRRIDVRKRWSWPIYVTTLHARLKCPVTLLVYCPVQKVARWAAEPIDFGVPLGQIRPVAFGPAQTPAVTDPEIARRVPELAVLSILAHAGKSNPLPPFTALLTAYQVMGSEWGRRYHDFILTNLSAELRRQLGEFMTAADYQITSEWALQHFAEGKAEGKAETLLVVLNGRGIKVSDKARSTIRNCIDLDQLDEWAGRVGTVERVEDLGGLLGES